MDDQLIDREVPDRVWEICGARFANCYSYNGLSSGLQAIAEPQGLVWPLLLFVSGATGMP
jgi:hypothetical protein